MIPKGQRCPFNLPEFGTTLEVTERRTEKPTPEDAHEGKPGEATGRWRRDGTSEHPHLREL